MSEQTATAADVQAPAHTPESELPLLVKVSRALRSFVQFFGLIGSWMILPLILVTMWDVGIRSFGAWQMDMRDQYGWIFESTVLQEWEWHFHTALFALVLGYGYIWNTHVRVDLVRETLSFRKKAWLEFLGTTFFLLPYCAVVTYFAFEYAYDSWAISEISASTVGLSHRWIIKSVLVLGLILAGLAGLAVWCQTVVVLFGPQNIRFKLMTLEWPEEAGGKIEGKERLKLEELDDLLEVKAREREERLKAQGKA
ncbi:MAG: TRAP transporter small permease subunit [Gammaproteobacteria bacterium]|nr:TRAP transporter small permease subunit [Gammaproteobacteria bacterium]